MFCRQVIVKQLREDLMYENPHMSFADAQIEAEDMWLDMQEDIENEMIPVELEYE